MQMIMRNALINRIKNDLKKCKIVYIQAPCGWGKTVLLEQLGESFGNENCTFIYSSEIFKVELKRVETLQAYLKNMPDDKVVQSFDEIDRQKYSSETMTGFSQRYSTNIMSQVRGKNGGDYFDSGYEKFLEVKDASPEFKVIKSYVTRMGGCAAKNIDEATAALMDYLGRLATEGNFLFGKTTSDSNLEKLNDFYNKNIVPEFK